VGSTEDSGQRREIQLSLKSIVESSDRWLGRLRKRESRVRLASSFLTTILVFVVVGVVVLVFFLGRGQLDTFLQHTNQIYSLVTVSGLAGLVSGIATYFILRRKHEAELKELSSLITEMKKANGEGGNAMAEDALSLAYKIMTLLPELVRKRNQDSLLFGIVAFILTELFANNLAAAILVGVMVWLYFRYETRKTYEQEISKLEEQRRVFEQRKKDFIETL
jgi:hypothetical protein